MKRSYVFFLYLLLLVSSHDLIAQKVQQVPSFKQYENSTWVDSIMSTLNPDERIAQLIMVAAYSNKGEAHRQEITELIEEQKIGGLIFFQGDPASQVNLMNDYQETSKVPLLGAIDAEWGLGMRLNNTISYPFQMGLGAIQDEQLLYEMGVEIGKQVKRVGLHMNFAPVVDVNNNPNNPVINYRSFGEDKNNVASKASAYMKGMQDQNVLTTAKHFPGHGDTDTDSHYALPVISYPLERLDSLELYPFRKIIEAGIGGIMVAHLDIPALDDSGVPSTLSKPIITGLLKGRLGFEGLIVTDAMNMKGVTQGNTPGVVDKDAILAGNDLLEFTEDVPRAISEIRKAVNQGLITQAEIDRRVRKLLAVKQWVGLNEYKPTSAESILEDLNSNKAKLLNRNLVEASLTVLTNDQDILPVKQLHKRQFASVSFGANRPTVFQKSLSLYADFKHYQLPNEATKAQIDEIRASLGEADIVVAGLHDHSKFPRNSVRLSGNVQEFLSELSQQDNSIVIAFKNPYVLNRLSRIENAPALVMAYQDTPVFQEVAAELVFGGVGASGKLPVSVGDKFKAGDGLHVTGGIRLSCTLPKP